MALWPTVHSLILAMPETKTPTSCPRHDFLIVVTKPLVIVTPAASICSSASADYVVSGTRSIVEQRGYHLSPKTVSCLSSATYRTDIHEVAGSPS